MMLIAMTVWVCAFSIEQTFCVQGLSVVGVQQIDRVVEVVEETLKGECDYEYI